MPPSWKGRSATRSLAAFSLSFPAELTAAWKAGPDAPSRGRPSRTWRRTSSSQTCIRMNSSLGPGHGPPPRASCGTSCIACAFMPRRLKARFACSVERSLSRAMLGSPISTRAACKASSRTCCGGLAKTASKSQPPSWPPMIPTSAWSPDRTFSAAPLRRSDIEGSSGATTLSPPPPCSRTRRQWRPPTWPDAHWRTACLDASERLLHSRSSTVSCPDPAPPAPAAPWGDGRSMQERGGGSDKRRPPGGCCTCDCIASGRIHSISTCARPLGWIEPRPGGCAVSAVSSAVSV
mmetsp:Transcript_9997/g.21170  ORF Transcript_9997/g.21170 Transcript_9997/m.21170 type:complete len:292 (-) Transcript_9997:525-1400(-)